MPEHLLKRMATSKITRRIKLSFEILKMDRGINSENPQPKIEIVGQRKRKSLGQGRCEICPRKKDKKTRENLPNATHLPVRITVLVTKCVRIVHPGC